MGRFIWVLHLCLGFLVQKKVAESWDVRSLYDVRSGSSRRARVARRSKENQLYFSLIPLSFAVQYEMEGLPKKQGNIHMDMISVVWLSLSPFCAKKCPNKLRPVAVLMASVVA
jgi:hypothetical protein